MMREYLTCTEVAKELGVCSRNVRRWISEGMLPADRAEGSFYLVRRKDMEKLRTPFKRGRPRRSQTV